MEAQNNEQKQGTGPFAAPPFSAWIVPTEAKPGYYWRLSRHPSDEPTIVKVVEWKAGWLDGPHKPWRREYLAECFGIMSQSCGLDELALRGDFLLRVDATESPLPNAEARNGPK